MSDKKRLMIRLALSVLFGLCVMMVPLWLIVRGSGSTYIVYRQDWTRKVMKDFERQLQEYRVQHKTYPAHLTDTNSMWAAKDAWRRPFVYSLRDGKPLIESLGRDGVRGGVGLDADLSNRNPKPPQSEIPFVQIVTDPIATGMNIAVLICGALAGVMFFQGLSTQSFERKAWPALGASFLVSLCLAGYGAAMITMFHVPSGH